MKGITGDPVPVDDGALGDCFPVAASLALGGGIHAMCAEVGIPVVLGPKSPFRVVHGIPVGTGGIVAGKRYWHAWLEWTQPDGRVLVIDWSNGNQHVITRDTYYRLAQLDEDHVWRWTPKEAEAVRRRYRHWGPWVDGWEAMEDPSLGKIL